MTTNVTYSVGHGEIYVSNGIAYIGDTAETGGDTFKNIKSDLGRHVVTLSDRMLGGAPTNWVNDKPDKRYAEGDEVLTEIKDKNEEFDLKALGNAGALDLAKQYASVIFKNNTATLGGAIGSNGSIIIGDKDKEFDLKVTKKWDEKITDHKEITVNLISSINGKEYIVDTAKLNNDNNFEYTFKGLPLEAGDKKILYSIREVGSDDYDITYENDSVNTGDLENGAVINSVVTNNLKPQPPEPEVPDKPGEPWEEIPDKPENPNPEDPKPEIPGEPVKPRPNIPVLPIKPRIDIPSTPLEPQNRDKLPNTGVDGTYLFAVSFATIIGILYLRRRNKINKY